MNEEQHEYDTTSRNRSDPGAILGACLMGALFLGVMAGLWALGMLAS